MNLIKSNFLIVKDALLKDFDWLHLNTGYEGSGKSTLAIEEAHIVDPDMCAERICFQGEEFISVFKDAKKGQAIILDEGVEGFYNRRSMNKLNIELNKALTICRAKNLLFIINIASIEMIDRYIRRHRARTMSRVVERGIAEFYTRRELKKIQVLESGLGIVYPEPTFIDTFPKITGGKLWDAYLKKKEEYIDEHLETTERILQTEKQIQTGELVNLTNAAGLLRLANTNEVRKYIINQGLQTIRVGKRDFLKKSDLIGKR